MARFKNGILGAFSGKIGPVNGYELNGQTVFRVNRKHNPNRKCTEKEIANRAKFALTQRWLQPITDFLRVGFQGYAPTFQGFTAAKSYLSHNAVIGEYPDYEIDPALALVSYGTLDLATIASALSEAENTITFNWDGGDYKYDDKAMFLAYNIETGYAQYDMAAVWRQNKTGIFTIDPDYLGGKEVHVYLAFVNESRTNRSKSQYLGKIVVL